MIVDDPKQWTRDPARPPAPRWCGLNINSQVRVKLTPTGLEEYRRIRERQNASLPPSLTRFSTEPPLDAQGFFVTSMWVLMRDFGHLCELGRPLPFGATILLAEADLSHE